MSIEIREEIKEGVAWNGEEVHADIETERQISSIVDDLLRSMYHAGRAERPQDDFRKDPALL
jgi:hypothetical protein